MTISDEAVATATEPPPSAPSTTNIRPDKKSFEDLCPICHTTGSITCKSCKKISYCSKEHQKKHLKVHKTKCYPLIHHYDKILGSRLIATRSIKQGEIILREKPIISGPNVPERSCEETKICLGCFAIVKSDYICPTCLWPYCGEYCISEEHHEMECKIFTSHKFLPSTLETKGENYIYEAIIILRGVLLKKQRNSATDMLQQEENKWSKILRLDEMWEEEESTVVGEKKQLALPLLEFSQFCHEFIMNFKVLGVTTEDIECVLRVRWGGRAFVYEMMRTSWDLCGSRSGTYLYYTASQATQNCIPNTSWQIQPNTEIQLRALQPIQFGRTITISYVDITEGTLNRQLQLGVKNGYITTTTENVSCLSFCECERCKDPTELGTFYSAIKCTKCCESENMMLPVIKSKKFVYKCQNCGNEDRNSDVEILNEKCKILYNNFHSNNHEIFKTELKILEQISGLLKSNLWSNCDDKNVLMVEEFMNLSKKWLEIANVIFPGLSKPRGILLNYFQQALTIHLIIKISNQMRNNAKFLDSTEMYSDEKLEEDFIKIINSRRETSQIFFYDMEGSYGHLIAQSIVQSSPEIEILKRYIFMRRNCIINY